ncbi:hypothetical protein WG909_11725 [Peptostreptococcaceae bacterium AGR-M142]
MKKIKDLEIYFKGLENKEFYLSTNSEEDWMLYDYDSYDKSFDDEYDESFIDEYDDSFGIKNKILEAFDLANNLFFEKKYIESVKLYERIFNVNIHIYDELDEDWTVINNLELFNYFDFDYKHSLLNMLYGIIKIYSAKERIEKMYKYISMNNDKQIDLEDIFSINTEDIDDIFIDEMIDFLEKNKNDIATKYLIEAYMHKGGLNYLCNNSLKNYLKHPILLKVSCQKLFDKKDYLKCEEFGLKAIKLLPEYLVIRSDIGNLVMKSAIKLNHTKIKEHCYKIIFYSKSTVDNYIRLFQLNDYKEITKESVAYAMNLSPNKFKIEYNNMKKNSISSEEKDILRFFSGDFDYLYNKSKNQKTSGYKSYDLKSILRVLLLFLLSKNNSYNIKKILKDEFISKINIKESDKDEFIKNILNWKKKQLLKYDDLKKFISWIEEETNKIAKEIVGRGARKEYYKVATLVVCLSEVMEANGFVDNKNKIIDKYISIYYNKRAFKSEVQVLVKK